MNSDTRASYRTYQAVEEVFRPMDRTPTYVKFLIATYLRWRSRLYAPGRAYDTDDSGMLAIGGSAHCDLMDMDVWLQEQDDDTRREAYEWSRGASQEDVSYWRGFGRGNARRTVGDKRQRLADKASAALEPPKPAATASI